MIKLIDAQLDAANDIAKFTIHQLALGRRGGYENGVNKNDNLLYGSVGSGKTLTVAEGIRQTIEQLSNNIGVIRIDMPVSFIFISTTAGDILYQSEHKFEQYGLDVRDVDDLIWNGWYDNAIYFLGLESVRSDKNTRRRLSEQARLDDRFTDEERNNRLVVCIFDEAHHDFDAERTSEFLSLIDPDVIWSMTATPKRGYHGRSVTIDMQACIDENIIVDKFHVNSVGDASRTTSQSGCIAMGIETEEMLCRAFRYFDKTQSIIPLTLIQIGNDKINKMTNKDNAEDKSQASKIVDELIAQGVSEEEIAVCLSTVKMNGGVPDPDVINHVRNSTKVKYLVIKVAAATGWDCTRARQLIRLRKTGVTLDKQTVGRIARMPVTRHSVRSDVIGSDIATNIAIKIEQNEDTAVIERYGSALEWLRTCCDDAFIVTDDAEYTVPDNELDNHIDDTNRRYAPTIRSEYQTIAEAVIPSWSITRISSNEELYHMDAVFTDIRISIKRAIERNQWTRRPEAMMVSYAEETTLSHSDFYHAADDMPHIENDHGYASYNGSDYNARTLIDAQVASGQVCDKRIRQYWNDLASSVFGGIAYAATKTGRDIDETLDIALSNFSSMQRGSSDECNHIDEIIVDALDRNRTDKNQNSVIEREFSIATSNRYYRKAPVDAPAKYIDEKMDEWTNSQSLNRTTGSSSYNEKKDRTSKQVWHSSPEIATRKALERASKQKRTNIVTWVKLPDDSSTFSMPYIRSTEEGKGGYGSKHKVMRELGEFRPDWLVIGKNKTFFIESKGGNTVKDNVVTVNDIDEHTPDKFDSCRKMMKDGVIGDTDSNVIMSTDDFAKHIKQAYGTEFGGVAFAKPIDKAHVKFIIADGSSNWTDDIDRSEWIDEQEFFSKL